MIDVKLTSAQYALAQSVIFIVSKQSLYFLIYSCCKYRYCSTNLKEKSRLVY